MNTNVRLLGILLMAVFLTVVTGTNTTASMLTSLPVQVQWSPDGRWIAYFEGTSLGVIEAASHTQWIGADLGIPPSALAWSADSKQLAVGTEAGYLSVWDINRKEIVVSAQTSYFNVLCLAWYPDNSYLLVWTADKDYEYTALIRFDVSNGQFIDRGTGGLPSSAVFDPSGQLLATSAFYTLSVQNITTQKLIARMSDYINVDGNTSTALAWSPDGTRIVTGNFWGYIPIWDVSGQHGQPVQNLSGSDEPRSPIRSVIFSPDGQRVLSINANGIARETHLTTETVLAETVLTANDYAAWSPYGARLAVQLPARNARSASGAPQVGLDIRVPFASLEKLNELSQACVQDSATRTRAVTGLASQRVNSLDALPDFIAQVEALPEGAIPAACRADLLAVAEALR